MSEKKIDGFTIEEIAECNDFLDKRVQEIHKEKQILNERWELLKLYLEASKEECLYSPHEIATLQDVICKMDELEGKIK